MKAVFYLTDKGLTCYKEQDLVIAQFCWNEVALIDEYLSNFSETMQVTLVLDVIEEDIYFEWAPQVLPWEKKAFLDRRKARFQSDEFLLTELKWTNYKKESGNGRKEELILTSLLASNESLLRFFKSLEEAQVLVTKIYSKPFLLVEYLKKRVNAYLKLPKETLTQPFLMVSRETESSFRQIFFYEGQLTISRLVEIDSEPSNIVQALVNETNLAVSYARSQSFMPQDGTIGLVFLDSDSALLEKLFESCQQEGLLSSDAQKSDVFFQTLTFNELTKNSQYHSFDNARSFSQQAMVDFIFNDQPKGFYSLPYIEKIQNFFLGRQVFIGLNILLLLGGLYYIVISGVNAFVSWEKKAILEQKISEHQREVSRLRSVVKIQDNAQHVKDSVELSEAILKLKLDRLVSFDITQWSELFSRHEHIQLASMDWKTVERFDSRKSEIILDALVFPFYDAYKDPVKWVDEFIDDLKSLSSVEEVVLQKEPLNRDLSQVLIINATQDSVDALPFTVKIRVKDVESK